MPASVGETIAIVPLIESILDLGVNVVLTTGTVTSAQVADERLGDRIIHQFVPLDLKPAISASSTTGSRISRSSPRSEIWPMTIMELGKRRIPQVLVNGRLSERSFAAWKKRPYIAEALFENLSHVVAQSDTDAERFEALGARPVTVSGNLKVDTNPPPVDERALHAHSAPAQPAPDTGLPSRRMRARNGWRRNPHDAALDGIRPASPIIVPRHPERALALAVEFAAMGLKSVMRSSGERIRSDTDILLGDTIGEMGLYLEADRDRLRRPLADLGGRPEPARAGDARNRRACGPQRAEFPRGLSAPDR